MKRTQNEAASDQFTKDMERYGQTVVDGKREALIGYRQELWDGSEGVERRLVIKLFSETLGWRGSAEMMLGRSLQLSLSAGGQALPVFSINLARHDQLIQLERVSKTLPFMPERFSFFIQNKSEVNFYTLRRHLFSGDLFPDFESITEPDGRPLIELVPFPVEEDFDLAGFRVRAFPVHHPVPTHGLVVDDGEDAVVFGADSGPTDRLWEVTGETPRVRAIVIEASFPARMQAIADGSGHLTPATLATELAKAPPGVEILVNDHEYSACFSEA